MKAYVVNFNGILDGVIAKLSALDELADGPHEADVFVLWQDIRGQMAELCEIAQKHLGKPVVVVQHGRGATRDYSPPNSFSLQADHICVWGEADRARMLRAGVNERRITVTGCPLFSRLKPRVQPPQREGVNILFAPVISSKEEPENILVYATLKKWECDRLIEGVYANFEKMKQAWATEENNFRRLRLADGSLEDRLWQKRVIPTLPRSVTYARGLLNVKLTGVHDLHQYMAPVVATSPDAPNHVAVTAELLANTDVLVCLEEGTMQLMAHALDIPVILADIFKYGDYGGVKDYDRVEKIKTPAVYCTTKLEKLPSLLDHALKNPKELRKARIRACEQEGGAHLGDADANIIAAVRGLVRAPAEAAAV